ncbi:hypothetical protein H7F51_14875 [Novosphingobium flavum]|uniref:Uncharacterized protein n=2 Tax=Novosphingobium flavum TaxID=1778672 RepID=A0A7X1FTP3_9SPHN|nr:hypothetical protein [Novosphingobium flavum]MBC2666800.1 hypothetical protein [Novosphingobium flavum]
MALSAAINAVFSLGFFLAVFGLPGRRLAWGWPDRLAIDFLPQAGMVALMSALVPVLVERRAVARAAGTAMRPVRAIVLAALAYALCALALGGILGLACARLAQSIDGAAALALKLAFGAVLGATITRLALRTR